MLNFINDSRTVSVALCEGRHAMPEGITSSVYPMSVDPTDIDSLDRVAVDFVRSCDGKHINLVVTGLSVALVSVIKAVAACAADDSAATSLTLWHFNRDTGDYYAQKVVDYPRICPFCGHIMGSGEWACGACGST